MASNGMDGSLGSGDRQPLIRGITAALLAVSVTVVSLRILARQLSHAGIWWDDCLIVFGGVITVVIDIMTFVGVHFGLGLHTEDAIQRNGPQAPVQYAQILFSTMLTYQWAMTSIKLSILLLYFRLFKINKLLRWAVYSLGTFVILWHFSYFFALLFQCTPVAYFWDRTIPGGHCVDHGAINNNSLSVSNAATNVFTDIMILIVPLPLLWNLQLSIYRKAGVSIVFILGGFDCAVGIIRMKQLINGQTADLLWSNSLPQLWTVIELSIAIVCACLPVLVPLIRRFVKSHVTSKGPYSLDSKSAKHQGSADHRSRGGFERMPPHSPYTASASEPSSSEELELRSASQPPANQNGISVTTNVSQYSEQVDVESAQVAQYENWFLEGKAG